MSLQVWLPLVKDFKNQGLSKLKFASFRYIRFVVNAIKGGADSYTQLSRLEFIDAEGNLYKYPAGTTVSSSMTGYAASEPPVSIIDGNVNTKFCAPWGGAGAHLTIVLGSSETIDISRYSRFQWYTANDGDWRDPISFEVQFSNDGTNFVKGVVVTNASITSTRYALAYTGNCFGASAGKIGSSCYYNPSYTAGGLVSDTKINLGNKLSMCCWVNFSALMPDSALGGSMGGQHRYPNCTGMGLTIKYISSSTGYLSCNTGDGNGNRTYNTYCGNTLLSANTWYHVVFTYDGSTIKFYVNGKFDGSHSYTAQKNVEDYVFLGAWSFEHNTDTPVIYGNYKLNGKINDFRIYDHTLSAKEIKLLSQGLAAHYQLKGMGRTNFLKGSGLYTEKSPLIRNASDVSHMYDSYIYHNDILSVTAPIDGTYTWIVESDGVPSGHVTSGTVASSRRFSLWLQNTSTGNHYSWSNYGTGPDGKHYGSVNIPAGTYKVRTNLYAADNVNYTVKFWDMKVVQGVYDPDDIWCPNSGDALYNTLGLNREPDCSGYENHGTKIGTFDASLDSPRYSSCYMMGGSNNTESYLDTTGWTDATISAWVNPSTFAAGSDDRSCIVIGGFYITITTAGKVATYCYGKTNAGYHTSSTTLPLNTWTHIVATWNELTKEHKLYINGNCEYTISNCSGAMSSDWHKRKYIGRELWWAENHDNKWHRPFTGKISDVRIYSTALSDADISNLYKNSAFLTKNGELMAYDFCENIYNRIDKDGVVTSNGFSDKTMPTYDMKVKALDDSTTWARIHWLDVTRDKTWFTSSEVSKCTNKSNRYSRMGIVDKYKSGSEYEFMLAYPSIKRSLPSGYTKLNYIEATGTQWINTGVTGHARWEFDIQFTNTTKRQLMGYFGNGDEYWGSQTDGRYGLIAGSTIGKSGGRDTIVHDYMSGAATLWVQDSTLSTGGNTSLGSNQYQLFNIMGTYDYTCHAKMWRCKCVQGGSLIRDFVPAIRNSDGYVGLYDIVNNVFYGNSGSGGFIAGNVSSNQSIELYNRWIQTSSPNASSVTGFKPITTAWAAHNSGIRKNGSASVYNCDSGDTWYAPIGQLTAWSDTQYIPAADGSSQTETELWVRTDRLGSDETRFNIYNGFMTAKDFIEI